MSALLRRAAEGSKLKRFHLSDVPEHIRHKAVTAVYDTERYDGRRGYALLKAVADAKHAAMFPDPDVVHYVSQDAWDEMLVQSERMLRNGTWKRYALTESTERERADAARVVLATVTEGRGVVAA